MFTSLKKIGSDRTEARRSVWWGLGGEWETSAGLAVINLMFSFQRLLLKPVEGHILSENLVIGVDN